MTGQRVSDEQLAGWEAPTDSESPDAPYIADVHELRGRLGAAIADLRAAREENRQLRERIRAGRVLHFVDAEGLCDMCVERWPCPTEVVLGGGSSD